MKITVKQYGQILQEILELREADEQKKALEKLADLIVRNKDQKKFSRIILAGEKLLENRQGIVQVEVFLPRRMEAGGEAEKLLAEILAKKESSLAGKIKLVFREDPSLLGGLKLKIGDEVWDASWKRKISRLGAFLKNGE